MSDDNKNLMIAIVLSFGVLLLWETFSAKPAREAAQQAQQAQPTTGAENGTIVTPGTGGDNLTITGAEQANGLVTRAEVVARSQRIMIDTPSLSGSVSLTGGRIDDLQLKKYREELDPESPTIVLLSPSGSSHPYFAEFGWRAAGPDAGGLPNGRREWTVESGDALVPGKPVTLAWKNDTGLIFRRTYTVDEDYLFNIEQSVENTSDTAVSLQSYSLIGRVDVPDFTWFWVIHEGLIGMFDEELQELDYEDIEEAPTTPGGVHVLSRDANQGWIGFTDKYWMTVLVPQQNARFQSRYQFAEQNDREIYNADIVSDPVAVEPGATAKSGVQFFAGAKKVDILERYEAEYGIPRFVDAVDWGWFWFLTKPLFYVLSWLYGLVGNFGIAILGLTVLVKIMFFYFADQSYRAMAKMKKLAPEIQKIRERAGDDKAKLQTETMALYQKEKVNPLAGCLPILIQIPVFFSLYKVLFVTIDMRHAPFFGWIQDLSAPDPTSIFNLFGLLPYDVPSLLLIGVWPLVMGITMYLQQKLNPPPPDPTQAQIFMLLPFIFTFMLASFPAGLVIYWAWNNILSVIQQMTIMRRMGVPIEFHWSSKPKEPADIAGK